MSKLIQPNGDDYPDAAGKHLTDAELLINAGRPDGAGYLTGYVVECVLKTYILLEQSFIKRPDRHHRLSELSQKALRLAALSSARTAKYPLALTPGHAMYDTHVGWRETLRYGATATVTPKQAQDWLVEARAVYAPAIPQMRVDGLI